MSLLFGDDFIGKTDLPTYRCDNHNIPSEGTIVRA